jgi:secreted trypsin-like serine protease
MRLSRTTQGGIVGLWIAVLTLLCFATPATAITWGWPDGELHRNVGAMVIYDSINEQWFQGCSGTLIHKSVFLTAGHCTDWAETFNTTEIRVNFAQDALDFSNPTTWREVEFVITHPDYAWLARSDIHDVGVLILKEPVLDRKPAKLPKLGLLDELKKQKKLRQGSEEEDFVVVGYGATLHWPPSPPDPKHTYDHCRQFAFSEYQALLPAWLRMSQNNATDDGGTSYGDSGGPAFWIDPQGREILVGITSWGDVPCVATGFDYRTDIPQTQDFLCWVLENCVEP